MLNKIQSVLKLLQAQGPEKDVPKHWLFRTGSTFDRKFEAAKPYTISESDGLWHVRVKDQLFLWPSSAPAPPFIQILSEIMTPGHPHQYLYGPTQIGPEDVVLDIGACEGAFSAVVTARAKHVIAVEPSRGMCALMTQLFELRGEQKPEILNCLLGSEPGTAYFLEDKYNPGASRISSGPVDGAYELPVRTLDEAVAGLAVKPTFIKCDAEGAEPAIFAGGKEFLRTSRPKLAVTTYHNDGDFAAMHSLLTSLGYNVMGKGFLFANGVLRVQMIHAW